MTSNIRHYLKAAGDLIKGDLANAEEALKEGRETRKSVLWQVLCNLLPYAQNHVFREGYSRKLAAQFRDDLVKETGLSEKQAAKYTESISAGLGVRGLRKGLKMIDGLPAACGSVKDTEEFLVAIKIDTFNKFRSAVRVDKTPVQDVGERLHKLTDHQRTLAMQVATRLDKAEEPDTAEA